MEWCSQGEVFQTEGIPIQSPEYTRNCADQTGGQGSSNNGSASANVGQSSRTSGLAHERRIVQVRGIVQGVGFRPFIYSLAHRYNLTGLVQNDSDGVCIEVEGPPASLDHFIHAIGAEAPPLARIEALTWRPGVVNGLPTFQIVESRQGVHRSALLSPDIATCDECLRELFEPCDRRYRYPFINCTHCGPRFTITRAVPYDRAVTTMASFPLCPLCQREYNDPADRRFHAQPNACPVCGPQVRLLDGAGHHVNTPEDPLQRAAELLLQGAVLALKGLGGYHLCCSAFDTFAVRALRSRKVRYEKPFALMARDLDQIRTLCEVAPEEAFILDDRARPIVLLQRRMDALIAEDVAPRQKTLGVMLPYTPLHHLLLRDVGIPLVMTSGNRSDEPIVYCDPDALERLGDIADYFLVHNRAIHMRCDDSVVQVVRGGGAIQSAPGRLSVPNSPGAPATYPIRRSRGYAPAPLKLAQGFAQHTLACGGEQKNTFCVVKEQYAFVSHHIGDLENYETYCSFREGIEHYCRLFDVQPERVAYDLHPEYLSTKYALELEETGLAAVGVQHHHAHIASCLADNDRPYEERVIGVAFDGTGYGTDGAIWGGEFLEGSIQEGFVRRAHLEYIPLPGGAAAIREPWRMALAYLIRQFGEDEVVRLGLLLIQRVGDRNVRLVARILDRGLYSPLASSAGRLFDAVAALVDVQGSVRAAYEGQAAIELEQLADGRAERVYPFSFATKTSSGREETDSVIVGTGGIIAGVVDDVLAGRPAGEIAAVFHQTVTEMIAAVCGMRREMGGVNQVALSGGTFQNALLLKTTIELLERQGFTVYRHHRIPPNDGGISMGQAVLANGMGK